MNNKFFFLVTILFICVTSSSSAQLSISKQEKKYHKWVKKKFNGDNAFNTVAFVEKYWRVPGNTGFNESIYYVEKILQQAGFVKEINDESDALLTYRLEKRPMKRPTWEPVDAKLYIEGESEPVLQFSMNRHMIAMYSSTTPAGGVSAELVDAGKGSVDEIAKANVKGKIVFAEGPLRTVYNNAIKAGALGVLVYSIPSYNQPSKYVNSIQFTGIPYKKDTLGWGILLSYAAKEKLKKSMANGTTRVKVETASKIYDSEELTLVANVSGSLKPNERFVFSAHVQEPGANDNATGVGTLAEMARITAGLVKGKKILPSRTITFLWGDEIVSTARYIQDDSVRAKGIKWGLSLDMVGENTAKTGGTFLIEKMPDPSAIWTRGDDKHSEWGGSPLKESDMFPHYLNDLLLNRCLYESKLTGWVVKTNPFEGGSDHTPFLDAHIPGILMWHFTDVFYHTDGDRLENVSAEEMTHVGISALVTSYLMACADSRTARSMIKEITGSALKRLETEFNLSREAIQKKSDPQKEKHILETWRDWYIKAIGATVEISVVRYDLSILKAITDSQNLIKQACENYLKQL